MKIKLLKKWYILLAIFGVCICISNNTVYAGVDNYAPKINIGRPSSSSIYERENVTYIVTTTDNVNVVAFSINKSDIVLSGFSANISISKTAAFERIITFSNIKSTSSSSKHFVIKGGVALDEFGNNSNQTTSPSFNVIAKQEIETPTTPVTNVDKILPTVKIGAAKPTSIYSGNSVTYKFVFSDNVGLNSVNLRTSNIKLHGFSADISVTGTGNKTRTVTLKNIKGTVGVKKYITINSGVAVDMAGNRSKTVSSPKFSILANKRISPEKSEVIIQQPIETIQIAKCIDDLALLGSINKEINTFSSWVRSEKTDVTYAQENNYVAKDERVAYFVEYYNGSSKSVNSAKFELEIPYKVAIDEISEGGKITKQEDKLTVVEWNILNIKSQAPCRLSVKVRYLQNNQLEKSTNISEKFYVSLKTTSDKTVNYSYLRQLFIDNTEGKTGTYKKYLTSIDNTNSIRPNEEVTRAEFAKMLFDAGVVNISEANDEYKNFKDYAKIPSYARQAVSALYKTNILHTFSDGEFKPNNPILTEDVIEMIAKAAAYVSDNKLKVNTPVFIYIDSLTDSEKEISPKKDYVMELIRQNVISKYEFKSDKYMLRREAVEIINSLMFRGPYVDKEVVSVIKYNDLNSKSAYYYNMLGAINTYKYSYNYKLWEEIVEISE